MILFVSALSAVQMGQPQSCMVTANKKTYMLLALLYTLNQYRIIHYRDIPTDERIELESEKKEIADKFHLKKG